MVEMGGIVGSRLCYEQLKRIVIAIAGATAMLALIQAWNNGFGFSLPSFFSLRDLNVTEIRAAPPYSSNISPSIAPQSYEGLVSDSTKNKNNTSALNVYNKGDNSTGGQDALNSGGMERFNGSGNSNNGSNDSILSNNITIASVRQQQNNVSDVTKDFKNAEVNQGEAHNVLNNDHDETKNVSRSKEFGNNGGLNQGMDKNVSGSQDVENSQTAHIGYNGSDLHGQEEDWERALEEQLAVAKREIENAPLVANDLELYSPLYHNVSRFKRSYETMEKIFKVYVYADGERPYFHEGPMTAIYASEGWFMKQMEGNRQFVTRDYRRAHMYYIPYSVYEMRRGIPAPSNQNMPQITTYIKEQINMLASKYPFWNRTHGRDHFFVACHDWGPYTTNDHQELKLNAVKVLCNADLSDGFFALGKDGGLPETNLLSLEQPPRGLGGLPPKNRSIFAFFAGGAHGRVRPVLFKYWQDKDPDMKVYENLPPEIAKQKSYIQHMKESRYCLCPMGYEVSSPRMVEAMYYDCVPVIIADNIYLPFMEVIKWDTFSITVAEKDIANLKDILLGVSERRYLKMHYRLSKIRKHFLWHKDSPQRYDIFHMILHSVWTSRLKMLQENKRE